MMATKILTPDILLQIFNGFGSNGEKDIETQPSMLTERRIFPFNEIANSLNRESSRTFQKLI